MTKASERSAEETLDVLFRGNVAVIQKKAGYRFSLDSLLLAHFVEIRGAEEIVDLGTGNGVIPLALAYRYPGTRVTGLEIQKGMVDRALRSAGLNRLEERVRIVHGDVRYIRKIFPPESFDVAVCNPPYRGARSGRMSPDPEKRVARHEIQASLDDFLRAAFFLLRRGGKFAAVFPAPRMVDLLAAMRQAGLEPKRVRLVHSFEAEEATLVLAEGVKGGRREMKALPPLVVYARGKEYTAELRTILSGR